MRNPRALVAALSVLGVVVAASVVQRVIVDDAVQPFYTGQMVAHDVSAPLITLKADPAPDPYEVEVAGEAPEREGEGEGEENARRDMLPALRGKAFGVDAVAQTSMPKRANSGSAATMMPAGSGWTGLGAGGYAPPDTTLDVGETQVVQAVNVTLRVWDKATQAVTYAPAGANALFSGFGGAGALCASTNDGDPTVVYDRMAKRWVISQFALSGANGTSIPFLQCVAVSTTSDATGTWNRYAFAYSFFPDYPKLAVWPDAYYTTFNAFNAAGTAFLGAYVCAYDRINMLAGLAASQACYTPGSSYGSILVAGVEGETPTAGTAAYGVSMGSTSSLNTWRFKPTFGASDTASSLAVTGPSAVTVAGYSTACGGGACIPQSGTTNKLDSLADRLMYRFVYQKIGIQESLLVAHSVTSNGVAAVRWYELRGAATNTGTPTLFQQGTFQPDTSYRWMPSVTMDRAGNIAMVYSKSSSTMFPAIAVAGRLAADPLGLLTQGELILKAGGGSQTGTLHRWGDYSAAVVDPTDGCTIWASTEFQPSSGSFNWSTFIGKVKLPNCGTTGAPVISAQPVSAWAQVGDTATFSVTASGANSRVWEVSSNGGSTWTPIAAATGSSYTFTVASGDAGKLFHVVLTNSSDSVTSAAAALNLATRPAVTTQPVSQVVNNATTVSFTAAASGSPAPSVQWQRSTDTGTTWTDIAGATATTYSFTSAKTQNGYRYRVMFTNVLASVPSNAAALSVSPPVPGVVSSVALSAGTKAASATWAAPAVSGDSTVTSYTVKLYTSTGTLVSTTNVATRTWSATGLTSRTKYYITVAANNSFGTGAATKSSTVTVK